MTRMIIKAVKERGEFVNYLRRHLPDAEWVLDEKRNAMDTFLRAMRVAGDDPAIHMEEDIILTEDFVEKIEAAIAERPDMIIQFFSMRKADREVGSRLDRKFAMNQCHYHPAKYSRFIADYGEEHKNFYGTGYDTMMDAWLKSRREPYWIHIPSLVEHRVAKSMIHPGRSSKRQSFTFTDPME